jgi:DNA-binding CsgD family transcriptional regulator
MGAAERSLVMQEEIKRLAATAYAKTFSEGARFELRVNFQKLGWGYLSLTEVASRTVLFTVGAEDAERGYVAVLSMLRGMTGTTYEPSPVDLAFLSPREQQVVSLLRGGARIKQIVEMLDISEGTVRGHIKNVLKKTGAKTTLALVARIHYFAQRATENAYQNVEDHAAELSATHVSKIAV